MAIHDPPAIGVIGFEEIRNDNISVNAEDPLSREPQLIKPLIDLFPHGISFPVAKKRLGSFRNFAKSEAFPPRP